MLATTKYACHVLCEAECDDPVAVFWMCFGWRKKLASHAPTLFDPCQESGVRHRKDIPDFAV